MTVIITILIVFSITVIAVVLNVLTHIRRESVEVTNKKMQFDDYISLSTEKIEELKTEAKMISKTERRRLEGLIFKSKNDIRMLVNTHSELAVILEQIHSIGIEMDEEEYMIDWNLYSQAASRNSRGRHLLEQRYQKTFGISIKDEDNKIIYQKGTPFSNN